MRIRNEIGPALLALDDNNAAYNWMMSKTKPIVYRFELGSSSRDYSVAVGIGVACGIVIVAVLLIALFWLFSHKKNDNTLLVFDKGSANALV